MFYATTQVPIVYPLILDNKGYTIGHINEKDIIFFKENKNSILDIMNNRLFYKDKSKTNLYRVRYKRISKQMREFIYRSLLCGLNVYFATFTFSNEYLPFNRVQFRKHMQRTSKVNFILYCDYGEQTNRFHLHGFIASKSKLNNNSLNKFGFTSLTYINDKNKRSMKKILKYCVDYSIVLQYKFTLFKSITILGKGKITIDLNNLQKVLDLISWIWYNKIVG